MGSTFLCHFVCSECNGCLGRTLFESIVDSKTSELFFKAVRNMK